VDNEVVLDLRDLHTTYLINNLQAEAVRGVSLAVMRGQTVGLVGESGCGKSSVGYSILRILASNGRTRAEQCLFRGVDLFKLSDAEMARYRWDGISMIFQGAMNALNPVIRVDDLLVEILRTHSQVTRSEALARIAELFEMVGLSPQRMTSYPHELSGGMRQRVVIAMSLLCNPELIIADEPTTAFDVIVQDQILKEIESIQDRLGIGMILISHDIAVISETCDTVAVMYAGQIVESGSTAAVMKQTSHPYTRAMLASLPDIRGPRIPLTSLVGAPPSLTQRIPGCSFAPRCPAAKEECRVREPDLVPLSFDPDHLVRCHFAGTE
jgi:peptide/nickel transport system ATP-binding protein